MAKRPTTIADYIQAAPKAGQPYLRRLYAILKAAAPEAEEAIKWNMPFFIEPRFLFAFSAHKAHLGFNPSLAGLEAFREQLGDYEVTKMGIIKIRYNQALPEALIREIADHRVKQLRERDDESFW